MEQLLNLTASHGFPMVVSIYLLVRIETKLAQLADSIQELAKVIAVYNNKC